MVLILGVAVVALILVVLSARPMAARNTARAGYLDQCLPLFSTVQKGVADTGFARLSGQIGGQMFDVQVVPDSLNLRKLPTLWLLVTLVDRLPVAGTYDVMLRATGSETFSKFGTLPELTDVPQGFPEGCTIRSDVTGALPGAAAIARYLGGLDPARLKELVVAPTGVRLVWLIEEADRGRYLLFRDAEMGAQPLPAVVLSPLMAGLHTLRAELRADAAPKLRVVG